MTIALGVALGIVAGVLAAMAEAGLLVDPRRREPPSPEDHVKVFGLLAGGALPTAALSVLVSEPGAIVAYEIAAALTFILGLTV